MSFVPEKELTQIAEKIRSSENSEWGRILKSAENSFQHSIGAAFILHELGLDADTIITSLILAGFVDHPLPASLADQYGPVVTRLVLGVKKIDALKTAGKTTLEAENIRNMLFALTDDIRVIFIKFAQKLHALRILDSFPGDEQKTTARECIDIYAPLADRLGISWIKNELEDLSLKFLNQEAYQQIKRLVHQKLGQRNQFLDIVKETIRVETEAAGINVTVESRAKHFYSIYMKMRKRGVSPEKIYDLSGIRLICDSEENCYTLLGIIHRLWKPVSGCFKDYIAMPKPNGYRSLHTTVLITKIAKIADSEAASQGESEEGKLFEFQIRTAEMHQMAEFGVASHWLYKKGASRDTVLPEEIGVTKKLKEWKQYEQEMGELPSSWLEEIKQEILRNSVYVFTPQGKVIKLPAGATPIDFAFQVHTAIGEHCIGAKANGKIIPLSSQLKNSQVIEIQTSVLAHPSVNWLEFAKSPKARSKIRAWLEKNNELNSAEKSAEAKKKPAPEPPVVLPGPEKKGPVPPLQMVVQPLSSVLQVRIEDEKNLLIRYARCCNPITGDPIIGYVSRGRGIIIHRKNCNSLAFNPDFENRKIEAAWENAELVMVKRFRVEAKLSANLFSEIEGAIRKRQGHLIEGRLEETDVNRLSGTFTMQLAKESDLKIVMKNIRGIPGIIGIQAAD